ncbi:hypothetical protein BGZ70_008631 [Mortierella alpina]|uniref:PH domain-containing protein n=1 Tax=Mortierella alpina TaxID=64518 RepID=A0A9P6J365_MORAP|nr:hypothetical protein BGZ70_008631 [Mortierella alpina]
MTTNSSPGSATNSGRDSPTHPPNERSAALRPPRDTSKHLRYSTAMSNTSSSSQIGLSSPEDNVNTNNILLSRLLAYKAIVKNLQHYFSEIAQVEAGTATAMHKASGLIVVPFKDGQHQFLSTGGLLDVCVSLRDSAKTRGEQHANAAAFVEAMVVKNLRRLKRGIKDRIKAVKSDAILYCTKVFREREATLEKIEALTKAIGLADLARLHPPDTDKTHADPYVINLALKRQLAKQVHEENMFSRALKQCQEQVATFESHIIKELKQVLTTFAQHQAGHANAGFSRSWAPTEMALNALQDDAEWNSFLQLNGHQLFPSDLVDTDPSEIDYPGKESAYLVPVKTAHMSRLSSVLKHWKDGYFVLTMAGWLHVFATSNEDDTVPERSIYLPTTMLGPYSDPGFRQHVFSLEGRGIGGLLHRDGHTLTVRANSKDEMVSWWSELSKRAHSTTFNQKGDGGLNTILSRSASGLRSATSLTSGWRSSTSLATKPRPSSTEPPVSHYRHASESDDPSPPYLAQNKDEHNDAKSATPAADAAMAAQVTKEGVRMGVPEIKSRFTELVPVAINGQYRRESSSAYRTPSPPRQRRYEALPEVHTEPLFFERADTGSTTSLHTAELLVEDGAGSSPFTDQAERAP